MPDFATTSRMAAAVLALAVAGDAQAQAVGDGIGYLKAFGGMTLPSNDNEDLRSNGDRVGRVNLDYKGGYTLGLAAGWSATRNIGLEFEYAHRGFDYGGRVRIDDGDKTKLDGKSKVNTIMVNIIYNYAGFGMNMNVQPYVGGGLGAAQIDISGDTSDWVFAYQAMVGLGYAVSPNWSIYGEGRWLGANDAKIWPSKGLATDLSLGTFDVLIGARYSF